MKILLTGGAGYIGSHTAVALLEAGHAVAVVDDYSNSSPEAVRRVGRIAGSEVRCYSAGNSDAGSEVRCYSAGGSDAGSEVRFYSEGSSDAGSENNLKKESINLSVDDLSDKSVINLSEDDLSDKSVINLYEADVADKCAMMEILKKEMPDCIIHFAGLKAVGESVDKPVEYYRNNINTTLTLLECMRALGLKNLVFSSSATVYGDDHVPPFTEEMTKGVCTNPYGWTKWMQEQILTDAAIASAAEAEKNRGKKDAETAPEKHSVITNADVTSAEKGTDNINIGTEYDSKMWKEPLSVVLLRYFNPVGAHESGMIGEDPQGIPNNLMPYISQVAVGRRDHLTVFGDDYDTPDGTCRRDYIHVMDLAEGHVKAAEYAVGHSGTEVFNLGTGLPYSVLDMVKAFGKACGHEIAYEIGPRRAGDVQDSWADAGKALKVLGWMAKRGIEEICRDAWNWQSQNPNGYNK